MIPPMDPVVPLSAIEIAARFEVYALGQWRAIEIAARLEVHALSQWHYAFGMSPSPCIPGICTVPINVLSFTSILEILIGD